MNTIKGYTKPESRTVKNLVDEFSSSSGSNVRLRTPAFQRGIVWSNEKQAELIRSLKNGFPIGSLLFFKSPSTDGVDEYLLIDGLQRTASIRNYQSKPLRFLDVEDLPADRVDDFIRVYNAQVSEPVKDEVLKAAILNWMRDTKTLSPNDGFDAIGLVSSINAETGNSVNVSATDVTTASRGLTTAIVSISDISSIEIPVLLFTGSESDLPGIFDRINSTGTTLSKYEIFAATWADHGISISSPEVTAAIKARYYHMLSVEDIDIVGVKQDGTPEEASLFDYLFGLGKHLVELHPTLFGESVGATTMESIGFSLATVVHGRPLSQMGALPKWFKPDEDAGKIDPDEFEVAVLDAASFVAEVLRPYIGLKLNSKSATTGAHTELQITSMIGRALVGKYDTSKWEVRKTAKSEWEQLRKTLPQHYLVDILRENWRGSGDGRLFEMVWERPDNSSQAATVLSSRYLQPISKSDLELAMDQWFAEQLQLNQRSRSHVRPASRTFLRYVYSGVVTYEAEHRQTFELDHVFPVSRLAGLVADSEEGWPISAVANLALFERSLNRGKSALDLPAYVAKEKEKPVELREEIEKYLLLPLDTATIPVDAQRKDSLSREQFIEFLKKRFVPMKENVLKRIAIDEQ